MQAPYEIRKVSEGDLPLLTTWRQQPEVRRWWGDPSLEPEAEKLAAGEVAMWVVQLGVKPFGFVQDYAVHDWLPHHFAYLPPGARGLDFYIGEPAMIGHGHGTALLRQHAAALFRAGVPALGADPHPENHRAQRALLKAGFKRASDAMETRWGSAVLMDWHAS